MSYIEKSLGDGERVVALAKFHWSYTVLSYLALLIPLLILVGVFHFLRDETRDAVIWETIILLIMGAGVFAYRTLYRSTTEIGVTSHRFVKKAGLLTLKTDEFSLRNIEGVKVTQSIWGRIFGYGSLRIEGTGDDAFDIPNIADPVEFRRAIETAKSMG